VAVNASVMLSRSLLEMPIVLSSPFF